MLIETAEGDKDKTRPIWRTRTRKMRLVRLHDGVRRERRREITALSILVVNSSGDDICGNARQEMAIERV